MSFNKFLSLFSLNRSKTKRKPFFTVRDKAEQRGVKGNLQTVAQISFPLFLSPLLVINRKEFILLCNPRPKGREFHHLCKPWVGFEPGPLPYQIDRQNINYIRELMSEDIHRHSRETRKR
ncbi:hypothetical protein DJ522_01320 [Sulfolobus sp. F3]|nr:hypothetical protein DJ522_01320 [Sulfolobus sp. F3]